MPNNQEDSGLDFDPEAHKQRLAPGVILAARDLLSDENFDSAIVLLCQYGVEGAYGLVLNRPAHMPLSEIFDHPPESVSPAKNRRVYMGGPVQPVELQILQIGVESAPGSHEVAAGVHLGGAWEELDEILSQNPKNLRIFLGYSGWAGGQLEQEIELGAWEVFKTDLAKLLLGPEEPWFGGSEQFKGSLATL